jgi:beta-lactamase regulating signal transducer with metallopeptidase domain
MNDLSIALARSFWQVTIFTLAAAAVYLLVGRRRPGPAASVATLGLTACMGLTILACCPLPVWWTWSAASPLPVVARDDGGQPPEVDPDALDAASRSAAPATTGKGISLSILLKFISHFEKVPSQSRSSTVLIAIVLVVAFSSLAWVGIGIRALYALLRRSLPIADAKLLEQLQTLKRTMDVHQNIELRASSEVATAATVGWHKPILLLSDDWEAWSEAELQAVLAHELAHIQRADYATWLLANISVAMHFYHPLVHWLANRLRLQQELAADALGALHAGGPVIYRRALARLALRQDCLPLPGPARAFLPDQGTLLKRIAMLRDKDVARHVKASWNLRLGLPALIGVVALAVSTLRLPAQQAVPDQKPPAPAAAAAARPEFIRSYITKDADGVISFRVAEILARPEIKEHLSQYRKDMEMEVKELIAQLGLTDTQGLPHLEDIEQVSSGVHLGFHPEQPKGSQHSLTMSGITLHMTHDFDWKKIISGLPKSSVELTLVEHGGGSYYRFAKQPAIFGPLVGALLIPDSRTLVLDLEKNIQEMLDSKAHRETEWPEGWKRVNRSLIAFSLNNENNRFGVSLKDQPNLTAEHAELLKNARQFVFGLDGQEELTIQMRVQCVSPAAAGKMNEMVKNGLSLADSFLVNPKPDAPPEQKAAMERLRTLIKAMGIFQDESQVCVMAQVKMTLWDLLSIDGGF